MTRINLVPPKELCNQHLLAEWRELTRIPNGIISSKYKVDVDKIPNKYTVRTNDNPSGGKGHMKFFFDKIIYLHKRYILLIEELKVRKFKVDNIWPYGFKWPSELLNDYTPDQESIELNRKRIREMFPKNPKYFKLRY